MDKIGDCFLIAALSVLASAADRALLTRLFVMPNGKEKEAVSVAAAGAGGADAPPSASPASAAAAVSFNNLKPCDPVGVRFFHNNQWRTVTVDQRIPAVSTAAGFGNGIAHHISSNNSGSCDGGGGTNGGGSGSNGFTGNSTNKSGGGCKRGYSPKFGRCRDRSTLWLPLLEKVKKLKMPSHTASSLPFISCHPTLSFPVYCPLPKGLCEVVRFLRRHQRWKRV